MLIVCCGLPGSGKSYLAKKIARKVNARIISSDSVRKENCKKPCYDEKSRFLVYEKMFEEAEKLLDKGSVVLDATFYKKFLREKARKVAEKKKVLFFVIEKTASDLIVKKRMDQRKKKKTEKSDADYRVYKKLKKEFDEIKEKHFSVEEADGKELEEILNQMHLEEIRFFLSKKEAYSEKIRKLEIKETHISLVFLNGKYAYKIKKPINLGFLDYNSIEKRKKFCNEELKINSMLSSDVYKKVVALKKREGKIFTFGEGKTVDYAVKMKQLPEKAIMTNALEKNKVTKKTIEKIATKIASFHEKRKTKESKKHGSSKEIWNAFSNSFLVEKQIGKKIKIVEKKTRKFLDKNKKLFEKRIKKGKIRECHGDLHSGNIFLINGKPIIFDAIEFNKSISCCDVAAEIAFMCMDLEFYRKENLSRAFIEEYCRITGDYEIVRLIMFYKCYRAGIRMMANAMNNNLKTAEKYYELMNKYAGEF